MFFRPEVCVSLKGCTYKLAISTNYRYIKTNYQYITGLHRLVWSLVDYMVCLLNLKQMNNVIFTVESVTVIDRGSI